jgi:hypothetical protein
MEYYGTSNGYHEIHHWVYIFCLQVYSSNLYKSWILFWTHLPWDMGLVSPSFTFSEQLLWSARCISAEPRSNVADRAHVLGAVTTGHRPSLWVESVGLDLFRFRVSLIIASGGWVQLYKSHTLQLNGIAWDCVNLTPLGAWCPNSLSLHFPQN